MSDQARNRFLSELLKKVHKGKRQVFCEDQNTYYLQLNTKEQEALGLGERVSVRKLIAMFILGNSTRLKVFFFREEKFYSLLTQQEQPYFEGKTQVSLTELKRFAQL